MPDVDGLQVAARVHDANPSVPVVLFTGHFPTEVMKRPESKFVAAVVQKPQWAGLLSVLTGLITTGDKDSPVATTYRETG